MTLKHRTVLLAGALFVFINVLVVWVIFSTPKVVGLNQKVERVRDGLPFALRVKDSIARETQLTSVDVALSCTGDVFEVRNLDYGFAVYPQKSRAVVVSVDNLAREAMCMLDTTEIPAATKAARVALQPLDLDRVALEIPDALKIASSNGLAEFCSLTRPDTRQVTLWLGVADAGLVWSLFGDSWDAYGPVAEVTITMDARTGTVLDHNLHKPPARPSE